MKLNFRPDQLIFSGILILLGLGQILQILTFGNFPPWLLLICVGVTYILDR